MHALADQHILLFLVQMALILAAARGLGELFRRWNQPAVTAELLVGVLLGPTVFGRLAPGLHAALFPADILQKAMLETVAWIGVFFLMLDTGLEIDFSLAWRQRGNALAIALSDTLLPLLLLFLPLYFFLPAAWLPHPGQRLAFALFMATVMTISAMPVAARNLRDLRLLKTDLGLLTLSALAVKDILGWILFSVILALFTRPHFSPARLSLVCAATVGFAALVLSAGRTASTRIFDAVRARRCPEPATSLTITLLLGFVFGAFAQRLGIHALFGFFLAGVMAGEAKSLSEDTRRVIAQLLYSLFVPLFFVNIGLNLDFLANFRILPVAAVTLVGIAARYAGAAAGLALTDVPRPDRPLIAIAHTPGGMMEIVMALLALEAGLVTRPTFVAVVFAAVFSSLLAGPWLQRALARRRTATPLHLLAGAELLPDLAASTREDALSSLALALHRRHHAADPALPGPDRLAALALEREQAFGTALGAGIAIPHVRIEGLRAPLLAVARTPAGLDWNAPDAAPVRHVFFLLSPRGAEDIHVQILARIARAMSAPGATAALASLPPGDPAAYRSTLETLFR